MTIPHFLAATATAIPSVVPGGEGSLLGQGIIASLLGLLGWFVRSYLLDLKNELKTLRVALDQNTRAVTVAVLGIAHLLPGAKPLLEEVKTAVDGRLKQEGL